MLAPLETLKLLQARLDEAIGRLPLAQSEGLASLVLELPEVPAAALPLPEPRFHFLHGHSRELRAGYGSVREWQAAGDRRFEQLRAHAAAAFADWHQYDPDDTGIAAFALLGFAATCKPGPKTPEDPFPNALLSVPEVALYGRSGQGALILTTALPVPAQALVARWWGLLDRLIPQLVALAPEPLKTGRLENHGNQPDERAWRGQVNAALQEIAGTTLEKVVLSRRSRYVGQRRFDVRRLVTALTYLFPSCQIVELQRKGVSFVAATPERLLQVRQAQLKTDAIAGTVPRDADAEQDVVLAEALCRSTKFRSEHAFVVDAVRQILDPYSVRLDIPEQPAVLKLNNVQHLWSPISAELKHPMDVFRLAEQLHPTPATNGQPRAAANAWLERWETIQRGWFTGAAGFVERDLAGELWVLLRVARIVDETADLFAGAGIVAGSDPVSEWDETEDKLSAMLTALQYA